MGSPPSRLPRSLHPASWWLWAVGLAVAASSTTNPLLLALVVAVSAVVVVARRGDQPWARAYRLYLILAASIVVLRCVLHIAVGLKVGEQVLFRLPTATLPSWAAGIDLGGTVYLEGLLLAAVQGMRLGAIVACIGAANALANPRRMLRTMPAALHEIGVAVVVSITVAPQLAESVQRVRRARRLRGEPARGLRSVARVALPVLQDTLDRSLLLAAAMDARGYGRVAHIPAGTRRLTSALMLTGLLGACLGTYGLLDTQTPAVLGVPTLLLGLVLAVGGLWLGGRRVPRSRYRPDPWAGAEWLTGSCGVLAAVALLVSAHRTPDALVLPVAPLAFPALPWLAAAGLMVAAAPAVLTPAPEVFGSAPVTRRAEGARDSG